MTSGYVGSPRGNVILPITAVTKQTKVLSLIKTTDITATAVTGDTIDTYTVSDANALFYSDSLGNWRMRFNIALAVASGTRTVVTITFAKTSIVTDSTSGFFQSVVGVYNDGSAPRTTSAYFAANNRIININHASATTTGYWVSGDVALQQDPTDYTTAANLEGVANVSAYIPPASGTTPGIVDTGTQTFAGNKTNTGFTSLGGDVALKCKKLTGTTGGTEGTDATVEHGLTRSKIVSVSAIVDAGSVFILPSTTEPAEYNYFVTVDATNVKISLSSSSSGNILSKTFTVIVWYIE